MNVDPREFWEDKILKWEKGRYADQGSGGILERLANRASDSLRFRVTVSGELLAPFVSGKRVVDLGCGSGLLAPALLAAGAVEYFGIDIATNAISNARRLADEAGITERVRFAVHSVVDMPELDADIVVSLGLTDWLTDEELDTMFRKSGTAEYLHAISELRASPSQWLHRLYVQLAYGYRTGSYVPRYFPADKLARIAARYRTGAHYIYRDSRLSFGALTTSLPVKGAVRLDV